MGIVIGQGEVSGFLMPANGAAACHSSDNDFAVSGS
jgi:hypothetical protein